jgi:hypothetical protein
MLAQALLVADPHFADSLENIDDVGSRFTRSDEPAPSGWRRSEAGGWVYVSPRDAPQPTRGWKIHVSATLDQAAAVVDSVYDYCVDGGLSFKFLRSVDMLRIVNSKAASRASSGKLITIYPTDERQLECALRELSAILGGGRGPYILSDLRWGEGPLYVRYGAFKAQYCFSADGEYVMAIDGPGGLEPDTRGTVFQLPPWVRTPAFLEPQLRAVTDASGDFPFRVEKALHFSNGGGVYRAVDVPSGRTVVLREARPHAGLDDSGMDAVARLERERRMLERLRGLDVVPQLIDCRIYWEHHFLVEEFIEGEQLLQAVARRHPLVYPDADPAEVAEYTQWALATLDRVGSALALLHQRGIVFGDLQPSNVMVRPDGRVCLVDFETAFEIGEDYTPTLGTAGFVAPWARSGLAVDEYALDCLRLAMFLPVTQLVRFDRAKVDLLTRTVADRFPVPPDFAAVLRRRLAPPLSHDPNSPGRAPSTTRKGCPRPAPRRPHWPATGRHARWDAVLDSMRDAILCSATPDRSDRLFPGDPRQFDEQAASLAFGAAGVLYALHSTGRAGYPEFARHVDWLIRANDAARWPRPGLFNGLAGTAYVLDLLGHRQPALATISRLREIDLRNCAAGLFGGLAGIGLSLLYFRDATGDGAITDAAIEIGHRLARLLDDRPAPDVSPVTSPGLMHGWSGLAMLFIRLFEATGDARHLDHAEIALARDLSRCGVPRRKYIQVKDGEGWIADLERGATGIAVALHNYVAHRPDDHFSALLDRIAAGLGIELTLSSGLLQGRAGLLAGLTHLGDAGTDRSAARDLHLSRFAVHAVAFHDHLAFPLDGLQRLSMDLGTGTAGVLLAVHAALAGTASPLPLLGPPARAGHALSECRR